MILVSKCYEIVTPESAEYGEAADGGFVFEESPYEFRELVREMRAYAHTSDSPARPCSWLVSYPEVNYMTGEKETFTLHPAHTGGAKRDARNLRYWEKALRAAGFLA